LQEYAYFAKANFEPLLKNFPFKPRN